MEDAGSEAESDIKKLEIIRVLLVMEAMIRPIDDSTERRYVCRK